MRLTVLIFTLMVFHNVFANNQDIITVGPDNHEVLWLLQKTIKNKNVYIMGYRSPDSKQIERVIPRTTYLSSLKELNDFKIEFIKKRMVSSFPFCEQPVILQHNTNKELLCLDLLEDKNKRKVNQWVSKQVDLLIK